MGLAVTAREATPADLDQLAQLIRSALAAAVGEKGGAQFVARELPRLSEVRTLRHELGPYVDPGHLDLQAFLAEGDGVALGVALVRLQADESATALVEVLYVDPEAREIGLAEALMSEVSSWGARRDAAALDAYALPGMRQLKNFYESHGFVSRLLVMRRNVDT